MRSSINRKRESVHVGVSFCAREFFGSCVLTCQTSCYPSILASRRSSNSSSS